MNLEQRKQKALRWGLRWFPRALPALFPASFPDIIPRSFDRQQILSQDFLGQFIVFLKAVLVMTAVLTSVWGMHRNVTSRWISEVPPSLAVSCLMIQFILAFAGLAISGSVKKRDQRSQRRAVHLLPLIRRHIAAYILQPSAPLAAHENTVELHRLCRRHNRQFEICLAEFLNNSSGQSRDRLSELARVLGFVDQWRRSAATGRNGKRTQAIESLSLLSTNLAIPSLQGLAQTLNQDDSIFIRSAALKALINLAGRETEAETQVNGEQMGLPALFRTTVASSLLVRVLLANDLGRHAHSLALNGIPQLLRSERRSRTVLAALEMVESWRYGLPIEELQSLLHHSDPLIRAGALRLAPLESLHAGSNGAWANQLRPLQANGSHSNHKSLVPLVISGLLDSDATVKAAALSAAAGLKVPSTLPLIEHCADTAEPHLARLACVALAAMGPAGRAILQSKIRGSNSQLAASAVESLAHHQLAHAAAFR